MELRAEGPMLRVLTRSGRYEAPPRGAAAEGGPHAPKAEDALPCPPPPPAEAEDKAEEAAAAAFAATWASCADLREAASSEAERGVASSREPSHIRKPPAG